MKRRFVLAGLAALLFVPVVHAADSVKATFGAGCFWCVEAIYRRIDGVTNVVPGYAGGTEPNPTYRQVGSGSTGHAEVVQITFDPAKISYDKLLEIFWKSHDPTNPNGVAPDFGKQYRSLLLYHDDQQKQAIERSRAIAQKNFSKPIATDIAPLTKFYPAEEYHHDYVRKNPNDSYVRNVSLPRLKELGLLGVPPH